MRRLTRPLWMIAQATAIGVATYALHREAPDASLGFQLFVMIAVVAFLTGLITIGWDAAVRIATGRPKPPPWRETPDQVPGSRGKALRKMLTAQDEKARGKALR